MDIEFPEIVGHSWQSTNYVYDCLIEENRSLLRVDRFLAEYLYSELAKGPILFI